jgi:protein-tyrosine phosphatase
MILNCNEIIPERLWVGRCVDPGDVKHLREFGITTLMSLQSDEDLAYYGISMKRMLRACKEAGIDLRRIATRDFDTIALAQNLPQCVAALEAALTPRWARVYLHCSAGINRGPTAAAAYLIRSRGLSAREAHDYLTARRNCSPYLTVLEQYEAALKPHA